MASISTEPPILTLINIFTVTPDRQQALVDILDRATEEVMRQRPGFVSASIHRSLDGRTVANYAQWRSQADFEAMQADPECQRHMRQAGEIAEKIEPRLYEVASVHD